MRQFLAQRRHVVVYPFCLDYPDKKSVNCLRLTYIEKYSTIKKINASTSQIIYLKTKHSYSLLKISTVAVDNMSLKGGGEDLCCIATHGLNLLQN